VAPNVTAWAHIAFPELRADRLYHQSGDDKPPVPSRPGELHPEPLTGRVEDWRAGLGRRFRPRHVSSPLRVERSVRISRTALPHLLCVEAYWTYPAGATFGPSRRTR
jgi:hypothetical protein